MNEKQYEDRMVRGIILWTIIIAVIVCGGLWLVTA